ncbi:hypothetical protein GY45DRAFT_492653 [Cubamyces sp. BRFM 1775]|nr:hypothetical protein GY45DRAFT_492653 [Cubamyces sp. BRFM 1775]
MLNPSLSIHRSLPSNISTSLAVNTFWPALVSVLSSLSCSPSIPPLQSMAGHVRVNCREQQSMMQGDFLPGSRHIALPNKGQLR